MPFFAVFRSRPLKLLSVAQMAQEIERLDAECAQLAEAVDSHATIDQAMGVVVALGQIAPEEAWRALRDVSQRTNTKLRTVAEHVLAFAQGGTLSRSEKNELQQAVIRYGGTPRGPLR